MQQTMVEHNTNTSAEDKCSPKHHPLREEYGIYVVLQHCQNGCSQPHKNSTPNHILTMAHRKIILKAPPFQIIILILPPVILLCMRISMISTFYYIVQRQNTVLAPELYFESQMIKCI